MHDQSRVVAANSNKFCQLRMHMTQDLPMNYEFEKVRRAPVACPAI